MAGSFLKTVTVEVETDIFLEDIDDDALRQICQARGLVESNDDISEMFDALKLGRNERALELARKIAQDHMGRIL